MHDFRIWTKSLQVCFSHLKQQQKKVFYKNSIHSNGISLYNINLYFQHMYFFSLYSTNQIELKNSNGIK